MCYAVEIWHSALEVKKYDAQLTRVQRRMALGITCAYRTVSTPVLLVLGRVIPIKIMAKERVARAAGLPFKEARAESLRKWEQEWEFEERGAWTRQLVPSLQEWYNKPVQPENWTAQFLTGHGCFGVYLARFKLKPTDACFYCGERDTPEHTFIECLRWVLERMEMCRRLGERKVDVPLMSALLKQGGEEWRIMETFIKAVLQNKMRDERRTGATKAAAGDQSLG